MNKQQYFDTAYDTARSKGLSASDSLDVASECLNNYKEKVSIKKTFALDKSSYVSSENILDILVGYPEPSTEEIYGGNGLEHSGWDNIPQNDFTFDINHFGFDVKNGVANNLDKKWQGFGVKVGDFYKSEDGLRAKAYIPKTELGKEFLDDYNSGKYGISIEADGYKEGNLIYDWEITGGTFHTDPDYVRTRPKKKVL